MKAFSADLSPTYYNASCSSIQIYDCHFENHYASNNVVEIMYTPYLGVADLNEVKINNSIFKKNYGSHDTCSTISVRLVSSIILENLNITDNDCTAITSVASNIEIRQRVNLVNNTGLNGTGLQLLAGKVLANLVPSRINMSSESQLYIINNTARLYGGGIYTDQTCEKVPLCCFF